MPEWAAANRLSSAPAPETRTLSELPRGWSLADCLDWDVRRITSVAEVAGTFQGSEISDVMLRLANISGFKGTTYWSVTDSHLETLIIDSFAVDSAHFDRRRADFGLSELSVGRDLVFSEKDNRLPSPVFYRLRVLKRNENQIVLDISNISVVKRFFVTLFEPGDVRTALFVSRAANGRLTCYAVSGIHVAGLSKLLDSPRSHLNRLLAFYGHVGGADFSTLPWDK
jgi:hypothetical protein